MSVGPELSLLKLLKTSITIAISVSEDLTEQHSLDSFGHTMCLESCEINGQPVLKYTYVYFIRQSLNRMPYSYVSARDLVLKLKIKITRITIFKVCYPS